MARTPRRRAPAGPASPPDRRSRWRRAALGAAVCAGLGTAAPAEERAVSVELLLAIDVSASVDAAEFDLQKNGIAAAFRDPELVALIARHPGGVAVAVMPWSSWPLLPGPQAWHLVTDGASASSLAAALEAMPRDFLGSRTAIGAALAGGAAALADNGYAAFRSVIDLSGDGRSNAGPEPVAGRAEALGRGITVNGLAVLSNDPGLDSYFRRWVVGGPGAFVAAVEDYRDFPEAILAKLLRELALIPHTSAVDPAHR